MSRARIRFTSLCLLAVALILASAGGNGSGIAAPGQGVAPSTAGAPTDAPFVEGEILIKFRPQAGGLDKASARARLNALKLYAFTGGAEHWRLGPGVGVVQAIESMKRNPLVQYAEPNYILTADVVPNDPSFTQLYGLQNTGQTGGTADADIDADMAWEVSVGSRNVVVGIIDTGIDYNHPDLAANVWTNPAEIPGNALDDDNNGFVDDVHGYDFINNDGDPFDDNGHGTHVAGTIGAVGNNGIGVAGVNWEVTLMGLKFLSAGGSGSTANAVRAVDYATMMGVDLTSNSWGGGAFAQTLFDAIQRANTAEIPFIAAAGNNGTNNDTTPHYPSSYTLANIVAVAATDHNDAVATFSNYGAVSVDIAAPGVNILSTQPGNRYQLLSGTSMATPHVAGVAALIKSRFPNIPAAQLKFALMTFADQKPQLQPGTGNRPVASGGRVNAFFSIADPDQTPPGAVDDLAAGSPTSNTMELSWTATGDDGDTGKAAFYQVRHSTSPIDEESWAAATRAGNEPNPLPSGSAQSMEVVGLAAGTTHYFAMKAFDEWGNTGPISNEAVGTTLPPPTAGLSPTSITDALLTGEEADHVVTLRNDGEGTLDFTIPAPTVGTPLSIYPALPLDKDEPDPRPGILGAGGPDGSGYRWADSDEPGGPTFAWVEISTIGTPLPTLTGDDQIANDVPIGFPFTFYGNSYTTVNVSTNGWFSFTNRTASGSITYSNQPLPTASAPENLVAPFWDDLNFRGAVHAYYYNDGSRFIVQWNDVDRHPAADPPTPDHLTFQAILHPDGVITYQYLTTNGKLDSTTVGIQNGTKSDGLTVAFNTAYLHDDLAVQFQRIPQWLAASPTSGRIFAGGSLPINVHLDASGLEGGTYPGQVSILTNDPDRATLTVDVTLGVTGAPDAMVSPSSISFGDRFVGLPHDRTLTVANVGTDTLHVTGISSADPTVTATPGAFDVPPHGAQNVTVRWTPPALGPLATTLDVQSDDAGEPHILVAVDGNAIPLPAVVVDPTSLADTLFSGDISTHNLRVSNTGGSDLMLTAGADQGNGALGSAGVVYDDPSALGAGGPDAFGYRWKDSDQPGGPLFEFVDITSTGTLVTFPSQDDSLSPVISMGMDFPFYGGTFNALKLSTNGWLTFNTAATSPVNTNGNLPSTSLPANSIAMFWDDLHIRGRGTVHYLYDGLRFIVQYTDFDRFSTSQLPYPAHLTFQAQLYPNGRIQLMYGTMTGFLTSATIGIQNGTRTIGLPVNFNTAYMHDNLAIRISRTPEWLRVTPAGATVPPGGYQDFTVTFDATERTGGLLSGNVVLGTNIPGQETVRVPATLEVIGAPDAVTSPAAFDFGVVYIGYPSLTSFYVVNNGTADLNVSDVTVTDPSLQVEDLPGPTAGFVLAPGAARLMNLRWSPTSVGPLNAAVQVHSDDPDASILDLTVTGQSLLPPVAVHSPASFTESLDVGEVVDRTLHLENQGNSDLTFGAGIRLLSGAAVTGYPELELKEGEDENDPRPGVLGNGGPDTFGYTWEDSDHTGGPAFNWVDIAAVGTPIAGLDGDDENVGPTPIGFGFPFYGNVFTSVRVSSNGFLSFTSTLTDLSNDPLPNSSTSVPENLLAVFWDNLHFRAVEKASYHNDGTRFIVQFTDVDRDVTSPVSHLTFQVILYPNGRIVYQYLTMDSTTLNSATIGMQNATRNDGLTVVHNLAYVHDAMAVEFTPPFAFPSVSPASGVVPPAGSMDLNVRLDATGLIGGDYFASIDLTTNDPARGLIAVPVSVHVTGTPDIAAQPASLTFPTTFVGFNSSLQVTLRNFGSDVLHVTGITPTGDFSINSMSVPAFIPVNGAFPFAVTFTPTSDGQRAGSLIVSSDDPDEPSFVIPLLGIGLFPPEIEVSPGAISTALPPGGARTKTLTISNTGASDLTWSAGALEVAGGAEPVTVYTELELEREEVDPRPGILGAGGPDTFGYRWKDSDDPGGPVFGWVDISGVGTQIEFEDPDEPGYCIDCTSGPFPIGFAFPFYGNTFNEVRVTTEGWISFTSNRTTFTNQPLPNSGSTVPENVIASFWDDLVLRNGTGSEPTPSAAYYYNDGTRFIVQWTNFYVIADFDTNFTFQVILYPNGKIVHQYLTMANGRLNSATIGQQNATKTDGLTVVHNALYMHDGLAIQVQAAPDWVQLSPDGGTIPAGGSQEVQVSLNAMGLLDGIHEAEIQLASNDPYTPLVTVPVSLNVGLVAPSHVHFDPEVLNLAAPGNAVKMTVELPAGLDPHGVDPCSVRLNDAVSVIGCPGTPPRGAVEFTDEWPDGGNGIEEVSFRFDRTEASAVIGEGDDVPVTIQGEVTDVQWWRGTTTVTTMHPHVTSPAAGGWYVAGWTVPVRWIAPPTSGVASYAVQLSRDGGITWEALASGLTGTTYDWIADAGVTTTARIRVVALDALGAVVGYDENNGDFTLAGSTLTPPRPVDEESLFLNHLAPETILEWKQPEADLSYGPASAFRILTSDLPNGTFTEQSSVTIPQYTDVSGDPPPGACRYYRVVSTNAAGDSE